jgi:1,4-dihydroxy-2-naphthoate octaprenyltransferase
MRRSRLNLILAVLVVVLTAASVYVVGKGGEDEPYVVIRSSDALVQVGVAMLLMFVWLQLAVLVIVGIARQRISAWWLSLLIWILVCEAYLYHSPHGYVEDVRRLIAHFAKA